MKVICKSNMYFGEKNLLTIGCEYDIIYQFHNIHNENIVYYHILNDNGYVSIYCSDLFYTIKEVRIIKLRRLYENESR